MMKVTQSELGFRQLGRTRASKSSPAIQEVPEKHRHRGGTRAAAPRPARFISRRPAHRPRRQRRIPHARPDHHLSGSARTHGARSGADLERIVADTVWHEIAHYFGMDEARVRRAERKPRRANDPLPRHASDHPSLYCRGAAMPGHFHRPMMQCQITDRHLTGVAKAPGTPASIGYRFAIKKFPPAICSPWFVARWPWLPNPVDPRRYW